MHYTANFGKPQCFNKSNIHTPSNRLLEAALWYAEHGYHVFPLRPGTKYPAIAKEDGGKGVYDATTDLDQIRRWWHKWPNANIGIHCGPSGLLDLDADVYKQGAGSLDPHWAKTVTVDTAHHGAHLWYKMPAGKTYGNNRGTLPRWIDVRGHGGYVVAPPSVFVEAGKRLPYAFVTGHRPTDIPIADLPVDLAAILEAAQTAKGAAGVQFTDNVTDVPDLSHLGVSSTVRELIAQGHPPGCKDRSPIDQKVITALIYAGATDDAIRGVFTHYAIGARYRDPKRGGDKYLGRSIGRGRAYVQEHPRSLPAITPTTAPSGAVSCLPELHGLRAWVQGPELATILREHGITRPAEYIKTLIAIVNRAMAHGVKRVLISTRELGKLTNKSHTTAQSHVDMLGAGITIKHRDETVTHRPGLNLIVVTDDENGTLIDLTQLLRTFPPLHIQPTDKEWKGSQQLVDEHLSDEAFVSYPRHFAVKMRPNAEILPHGLSAAALLIVATMRECGELTRDAICKLTGLSEYTVGATLRRLDGMGLLMVWEGKPYRYELHPNFDGILDELRPLLPSYGITLRRGYVDLDARIAFTNRLLSAPHPPEPRQEAKLKFRRDGYRTQQKDLVAAAAAMGMDITVKLKYPHPPKEADIAHSERLDRLRDLYHTGERAEHRPPHHTPTDNELLDDARLSQDWYRRLKLMKLKRGAQENWEEYRVWGEVAYQDAGWWITLDDSQIAARYEEYEKACNFVPMVHWA